MRFISTGSLWAYAFSFALLGCASSASGPGVAAPLPARRSVAPQEPAAKKALSAYEQRWASACSEPGALGRCPAPFDRPGVFFDAKGSGDPYAPPALCGLVEQPGDRAAGPALEPKRKALRACLQAAERGAWVDLAIDGSRPPSASPQLEPSAVACVAKVVQSVLPNASATGAQRVVVVNLGSTREGVPALSKQNVDAMIRQHADEVGRCYDGALEVWPGLQGRFAPSVVIWFDGSVALVRTERSSLDNPALECCINTAVRGWRFGPPEDGNIAIVSLPFVLGGAQP